MKTTKSTQELASVEFVYAMNPHQKFDWCIHITRRHFGALGQNIFRSYFQYEYGFILTAVIMIFGISGCVYTMIFYDEITAYSAAVICGGLSQVKLE